MAEHVVPDRTGMSAPWFAGAWLRRSIVVPGAEPTEPCEAWWIQTADVFVDVRVVTSGDDDNGLPFSSTRAFAGRFEVGEEGVRWHVIIDSGGPAPRTDGALGVDLSIDADDDTVLIEDAPGRFREVWVRRGPPEPMRALLTPQLVAVQVGAVTGAVWIDAAGKVAGRVRRDGGSIDTGGAEAPDDALAWLRA